MNLQASTNNSYNNADSFAMAFDDAWSNLDLEHKNSLKIEEKINMVFEELKSHPFLLENPTQSRDIASFRIKLLGLS